MEKTKFEKYITNNKFTEAIQTLNAEIEESPTSLDPRFQLASLYVKTNRHPDAVNTYTQILEIEPENDDAKYNRASIMLIISQSQLDIYASPNTHIDPWN